MDNLIKMIEQNGVAWEWYENMEIPCLVFKQMASDCETVISYNFVIKYRNLVGARMVDTGNLEESFVAFERKHFSKFFFREDTDLKWNYYLMLIVNEEESHNFSVCQLEQDDKYLRKLVMTEEEFNVYVSQGRNIKENPRQAVNGLDTYIEWQKELSEIGIEGILAYSFENSRVQNYLESDSPIRFQGRPVQNWENHSQASSRFLVDQIETLRLDGFREHCFSSQLEIPLAKVNLISGCNGTGKSSICSALEYAFTGGIAGIENEEGGAKVTFRNRENSLVDLDSKMSTKKKRELAKLWYGTVTTTHKVRLNTNFHTFNYLGLEASGKYMQELDINELVKNVLFGLEITEAEQKMRRYGTAFAEKEKEYRRQLKDNSLALEELQKNYDVEEISGEEIIHEFKELGYKGELQSGNKEIGSLLKLCRIILLEIKRYVKNLSLKCDKNETGNSVLKKLEELEKNREAYQVLRNNREKAWQDLQELPQRHEKNRAALSKVYKKIHHVRTLAKQGQEAEYDFFYKKDVLRFKKDYDRRKRDREQLEAWLDVYEEYLFIEVDVDDVNKEIQIREKRLQNLRGEADEFQKQIELRRRQNNNLETIMQEIIILAKRYGDLNEHAQSCPVCGTDFGSKGKLLEVINHQKQWKRNDEALLQSLLEKKAKKEEQLTAETHSLSVLKRDREKALKKGIAISSLKEIMHIDGLKSGKDIYEEIFVYMRRLQRYLENNAKRYEYVKKVLKSEVFAAFPEGEIWSEYLGDLLMQMEDRKEGLEALLKEEKDKEQELEQEYQTLIGKRIIFSQVEWEEWRQKSNGIQALEQAWEIDGDMPILRWIENYNALDQEVKYAEDSYRKQQEINIRKTQIAKLEEERNTIQERIRKCQTVCGIIGKQKKLEDVMEGFLRENARQIELFFRLLHRPKEFGALKIEDGKISFIRRSNGCFAESGQMSTGQRMALAFSVMITLHMRAANAPNFLMLDEPVANLDDMHVLNLIDLLRELAISGTQIIITTADSQMAKFLRRKFSFLKEEYSHIELTRKGDAQTLIDVIHYRPDKKAAETVRRLNDAEVILKN